MIKMKALRSFGVKGANEGKIRRGREFSVASEQRARYLESEGLAFRVQRKSEDAPLNKMDLPALNKAAEAGPFDSVGGETGATEPAPSSPQDQAQPRRRSRRSADDLLS